MEAVPCFRADRTYHRLQLRKNDMGVFKRAGKTALFSFIKSKVSFKKQLSVADTERMEQNG